MLQDSGSKRRQTSSVNTASAAEAPSVAAPAAPTEVPIEADAQEEDQGAGGVEDPMMSTQDYMAEAEELLANPMDTQNLEDVPAEVGSCSLRNTLKIQKLCCNAAMEQDTTGDCDEHPWIFPDGRELTCSYEWSDCILTDSQSISCAHPILETLWKAGCTSGGRRGDRL